MPDTNLPDYYEILQVSPRADTETIDRVFRHLARRYHPDNQDSGNADKFTELVNAHNVLSDPAQRAAFDVHYDSVRETRWRVFNQETAVNEIAGDKRLRVAILSLLYVARRNSPVEPGIGIIELEKILGAPDNVLQFQLWYLRENGFVERLTTGHFAVTAPGVDHLFELGGPHRDKPFLLQEGDKQGDAPSDPDEFQAPSLRKA
jgi:curved DNA-binding protein CbpA